MSVLEAINLECTRGDRPLITGLSFKLAPGELLHIVGSNGSGKTTLLSTLCGLSTPTAGEIRWNSTNIRVLGDDYLAHLSYVGHSNGIQGELTPEENLRVVASLLGTADGSRVQRALERVGLTRFSYLPTKVLSQGQKRRLALARLLIQTNSLWILDEPVSGLDARSLVTIEELLEEHRVSGGMIVITSHQELRWRTAAIHCINLDS